MVQGTPGTTGMAIVITLELLQPQRMPLLDSLTSLRSSLPSNHPPQVMKTVQVVNAA